MYEVAVCNYMEFRPYIEANSEEEARAIAQFLYERDALQEWEPRDVDEFFGADIMETYDDYDNDNGYDESFSKEDIVALGFDAKTKKYYLKQRERFDKEWDMTVVRATCGYLHRKMKSLEGAELTKYKKLYNALDKELGIISEELKKYYE